MRKKNRQGLLIAIFFSLFNTGQANATSVLKLNFNQVCEYAELIFEGKVISSKIQVSQTNSHPYTYITFEILDVIKGSYTEKSIELAYLGGIKNGRALSVSGLRVPALHERGIFFVESTRNEQVHPLVGWDQGHFLIKFDAARNEEVVTPVLPNPQTRHLITTPSLNAFKKTVRDSLLNAQ